MTKRNKIRLKHYNLKRISTMIEYKLYVSSISPQVGSIRGGTRVFVYGEGFR